MTHNYLFLFHTQYAIKRLNQQLQQDNFPSQVIDVPRKLSSECELGLSTYFYNDKIYNNYINGNIRAIYKIKSNQFEVVWEDKS